MSSCNVKQYIMYCDMNYIVELKTLIVVRACLVMLAGPFVCLIVELALMLVPLSMLYLIYIVETSKLLLYT